MREIVMSMNPISTTDYIKDKYTKYIESILTVKDQELYSKARKKLEGGNKFVKGPYIEITPPFVTGQAICDLIDDKILSSEFVKLENTIDIKRPLYKHQVKAVSKLAMDNRNIVVATGTGSGKTECFLIPIIDYLMKQKEIGVLGPGVRALLLYPMNALANDQMKRLRELLRDYPQVTFGRYTGETEEKATAALDLFKKANPGEQRLKNELLSRDEMRKNPPNILLTNYAMLEYLLLRPSDNAFFDGDYSNDWKFIVLDEAHSYKGANGTEISMLLKRLKERVNGGQKGIIRCIATSATLGGGKKDYKDVANFAASLFDEDFREEDIIESERIKLNTFDASLKLRELDFYEKLDSKFEKVGEGKEDIERFANQYNLQNFQGSSKEALLYEILKNDVRVASLQQELSKGPQSVAEIAKLVFHEIPTTSDQKNDALIHLVNLAVKAKKSESDIALLPARYHLFVRALEGMYAALYLEKQVFLEHRESIKIGKELIPVFELANCQKCGQEYIVGYIDNSSYFKQVSGDIGDTERRLVYFMLSSALDEESGNLDEDESFIFNSSVSKLEKWQLCTACGKIEKVGKGEGLNCCAVNDSRKYIYLRKVAKLEGGINTCPSCGSVSPNIVKRFLTSYDPATQVLAKSLYEMIPPKAVYQGKEVEKLEEEMEEGFFGAFEEEAAALDTSYVDELGRKLLIFSDNRQEAAFFAAYLNNKYNQVLWRKIILKALEALRGDNDIRMDGLANIMIQLAEKSGIFNQTFSTEDKRKMAYSYLMKEFVAIERNTGLEGIGLLTVAPANCPVFKANYPKLDLNKEEFWNLICVIFDSLRYGGAVTYPSSVNPTDEAFEPRNRYVYFRVEGSQHSKGNTILGWLPAETSENKRSNFIKKLLIKNGMSESEAKEEARIILKEIFSKTYEGFKKLKYISEEIISGEGVIARLNYTMWNVREGKLNTSLFKCKKCGKVTNYNIKGVCPEFRCDGELEEVKNVNNSKYDYYRGLYGGEKLIPMAASEHTAQLTSLFASDLQSRFEKGDINVLSCSTTFEMGVDVGQLEAIFMRNVPPETSNYIQRAGRAGRRASSTAFVLTFARRRSHDLNYYTEPEKIISGKIQPPYIEKFNEKIIRRHINSIIFAYFFRKHEDYFKNVEDLFQFDIGESAVSLLKAELEAHPEALLKSIKTVVPERLHKVFKLEEWGFIEELCGEEGAFTKIERELKDTLNNLQTIKKTNDENNRPTDYIRRIINTYLKKSSLNFLSGKSILPKYGFPVDVVSLDVLNDCEEAHNIELSRDLKMAITEFAPGSKVVASGKIWSSYAVNIVSNKGWPTYEYAICTECKRLYMKESDLNSSIDSNIQDTCLCGCTLESKRKFIKPEFGFSTSIEAPQTPGENKPSKYFATKVTFDSYEPLDEFQKKEENIGQISIKDQLIEYKYSPRGRLVLVNQGTNNRGFAICKLCGYSTSIVEKQEGKHKNKFGYNCPNTHLYRVDLGHEFSTDVLELRLPQLIEGGEGLWLSLLYAILEGASTELDIVRSDISGCLYHNMENRLVPSIILFDEVAGGAGHVKKISGNIERVIKSAYEKVSGRCGCGEETSCYGCLRNYGNQVYHDKLVRGMAKKYLERLSSY
jgi:ATP-dependent helicase YprA (DUF1998 family)